MEDFIDYKTALLAKEKGLDLESNYFREQEEGKPDYDDSCENWNLYDGYCTIVTQSSLQKWLREKNVIIEIQLDQTSYPKYCFNVYKYEDFGNWEDINNPDWGLYYSYEKALEDALVLGLKNVS